MHGKIGRVTSLKDTIGIYHRTSIEVIGFRSVGNQASALGKYTEGIYRWKAMTRSPGYDWH